MSNARARVGQPSRPILRPVVVEVRRGTGCGLSPVLLVGLEPSRGRTGVVCRERWFLARSGAGRCSLCSVARLRPSLGAPSNEPPARRGAPPAGPPANPVLLVPAGLPAGRPVGRHSGVRGIGRSAGGVRVLASSRGLAPVVAGRDRGVEGVEGTGGTGGGPGHPGRSPAGALGARPTWGPAAAPEDDGGSASRESRRSAAIRALARVVGAGSVNGRLVELSPAVPPATGVCGVLWARRGAGPARASPVRAARSPCLPA